MKVAIFGSTGMLGSMIYRYFSKQRGYELVRIDRHQYDAELGGVDALVHLLDGCQYAVNCIGVIKPCINEQDRRSIERAIRVNATFPHALAEAAECVGCRVIQIATDCVFSGKDGWYYEDNPHDPIDIYGKTKSLGEVQSPAVRYLRCSIIGPELKSHRSLLGWFLSQSQNATVSGYMNHIWNGITTLTFARLCNGIMSNRSVFPSLPSVQHVVPVDAISKARLLCCMAKYYQRSDIKISHMDSEKSINRALLTKNEDVNTALWKAAGYHDVLAIEEMIEELAAYK